MFVAAVDVGCVEVVRGGATRFVKGVVMGWGWMGVKRRRYRIFNGQVGCLCGGVWGWFYLVWSCFLDVTDTNKELGEKVEVLAEQGELWSFVLNLMVASVMNFKENPDEANGILIVPSLLLVGVTIYIQKSQEKLYSHLNDLVATAIKKTKEN